MDHDKKIQALEAFHNMHIVADKALKAVDEKLEEVFDETHIMVTVEGLRTLRTLISGQDSILRQLVEAQLRTDDSLDKLMETIQKY